MKNDENILYEYPIMSEREDVILWINKQLKLIEKLRIYGFLGFILTLLCYLFSATFPSISPVFLILTVILLIVSLIILKIILKADVHQLMISADTNGIDFDYYNGSQNDKVRLSYEQIESVKFADKRYQDVSISYKNENNKTCFFSFKLNENSYEQGFFLYYIIKIIPEKCFIDTRKIARKYGFEEEYFSHIR